MRFSLFFFFCFIFIFISCNNKKTSVDYVDSNLNIKIDTINIAIDSTFMQYYRQTSYDKTNKKLYVYNSSLHRLDYLDFDTQTNTWLL